MRQLGERTNHGRSWESEREAGVHCSDESVDGGPAGRQYQGGIGKERQQCGPGGSKQTQQHTGPTRREKGAVKDSRGAAGGEGKRANVETENIKKTRPKNGFPALGTDYHRNSGFNNINYCVMSMFGTFPE